MEFAPSLADPDVWIRAACKEDGYSYYEYLLVYVDDILILSHNPTPILTCIQKFYRLKEPASDPKTYLGTYIKPWSVPGDSRRIWSMSSSHYIKEALVNLENHLQVEGLRLTGKPKTPMRTDYRAELDVSQKNLYHRTPQNHGAVQYRLTPFVILIMLGTRSHVNLIRAYCCM